MVVLFYRRFVTRAVAAFMGSVFFLTSVGPAKILSAAEPELASPAFPEIAKIQVPKNIGQIQEFYAGKPGAGTVILVQDAHGVPQAQRSIRNLIDYFEKTYGLDTIALEGASSRLNPLLFRSFPDPDLLKQVFKGYLENGELTGTSMAAIFNERQARYEGVEDWSLYEEGYAAFLQSLSESGEITARLDALEKEVIAAQEKNYAPDLLKVSRAVRDFEKDKSDLLQVLRTLAQIKRPAPGSELLLILEESEAAPDAAALDIEVKKWAAEIKRALDKRGDAKARAAFNEKFQAFQLSQITAQEFGLTLSRLAQENGIAFPVSDALKHVMKRQKRMKDIEGTRFFDQFESYVGQVKQGLFKGAEDRALDARENVLGLLKSLAQLQLSRRQWEDIQNRPMADAAGVYAKMGAQTAFYRNAEKRDAAFVKNLAPLMNARKGSGTVLFVAGGFHTEGLVERLKARGVSYVLIMPDISTLPAEIHYKDHMRGWVSWKDYFTAEQGKVDVYKAFVRAARDRLLAKAPDQGRMLKEWRDQIIRDLAASGRLDEAADHTVFMDEKTHDKDRDALAGRVEKFIAGLKDLKSRNQLSEQNIMQLLLPATLADLTAGQIAPGSFSSRFSWGPDGLAASGMTFAPPAAAPKSEMRVDLDQPYEATGQTLRQFLVELRTDAAAFNPNPVRKWADFDLADGVDLGLFLSQVILMVNFTQTMDALNFFKTYPGLVDLDTLNAVLAGFESSALAQHPLAALPRMTLRTLQKLKAFQAGNAVYAQFKPLLLELEAATRELSESLSIIKVTRKMVAESPGEVAERFGEEAKTEAWLARWEKAAGEAYGEIDYAEFVIHSISDKYTALDTQFSAVFNKTGFLDDGDLLALRKAEASARELAAEHRTSLTSLRDSNVKLGKLIALIREVPEKPELRAAAKTGQRAELRHAIEPSEQPLDDYTQVPDSRAGLFLDPTHEASKVWNAVRELDLDKAFSSEGNAQVFPTREKDLVLKMWDGERAPASKWWKLESAQAPAVPLWRRMLGWPGAAADALRRFIRREIRKMLQRLGLYPLFGLRAFHPGYDAAEQYFAQHPDRRPRIRFRVIGETAFRNAARAARQWWILGPATVYGVLQDFVPSGWFFKARLREALRENNKGLAEAMVKSAVDYLLSFWKDGYADVDRGVNILENFYIAGPKDLDAAHLEIGSHDWDAFTNDGTVIRNYLKLLEADIDRVATQLDQEKAKPFRDNLIDMQKSGGAIILGMLLRFYDTVAGENAAEAPALTRLLLDQLHARVKVQAWDALQAARAAPHAELRTAGLDEKVAAAREFFRAGVPGEGGVLVPLPIDENGLVSDKLSAEQLKALRAWHQSTRKADIQMPLGEDGSDDLFVKKVYLAVSLWRQKNERGEVQYLLGKGSGMEAALQGQVAAREKKQDFASRAHSDFELYGLRDDIPYPEAFLKVFSEQERYPPTKTKGINKLPEDLMLSTYETVNFGGIPVLVPQLELMFVDKFGAIESDRAYRKEGGDSELLARAYDLNWDKVTAYYRDFVIQPDIEESSKSDGVTKTKAQFSKYWTNNVSYLLSGNAEQDVAELTPMLSLQLFNGAHETEAAIIARLAIQGNLDGAYELFASTQRQDYRKAHEGSAERLEKKLTDFIAQVQGGKSELRAEMRSRAEIQGQLSLMSLGQLEDYALSKGFELGGIESYPDEKKERVLRAYLTDAAFLTQGKTPAPAKIRNSRFLRLIQRTFNFLPIAFFTYLIIGTEIAAFHLVLPQLIQKAGPLPFQILVSILWVGQMFVGLLVMKFGLRTMWNGFTFLFRHPTLGSFMTSRAAMDVPGARRSFEKNMREGTAFVTAAKYRAHTAGLLSFLAEDWEKPFESLPPEARRGYGFAVAYFAQAQEGENFLNLVESRLKSGLKDRDSEDPLRALHYRAGIWLGGAFRAIRDVLARAGDAESNRKAEALIVAVAQAEGPEEVTGLLEKMLAGRQTAALPRRVELRAADEAGMKWLGEIHPKVREALDGMIAGEPEIRALLQEVTSRGARVFVMNDDLIGATGMTKLDASHLELVEKLVGKEAMGDLKAGDYFFNAESVNFLYPPLAFSLFSHELGHILAEKEGRITDKGQKDLNLWAAKQGEAWGETASLLMNTLADFTVTELLDEKGYSKAAASYPAVYPASVKERIVEEEKVEPGETPQPNPLRFLLRYAGGPALQEVKEPARKEEIRKAAFEKFAGAEAGLAGPAQEEIFRIFENELLPVLAGGRWMAAGALDKTLGRLQELFTEDGQFRRAELRTSAVPGPAVLKGENPDEIKIGENSILLTGMTPAKLALAINQALQGQNNVYAVGIDSPAKLSFFSGSESALVENGDEADKIVPPLKKAVEAVLGREVEGKAEGGSNGVAVVGGIRASRQAPRMLARTLNGAFAGWPETADKRIGAVVFARTGAREKVEIIYGGQRFEASALTRDAVFDALQEALKSELRAAEPLDLNTVLGFEHPEKMESIRAKYPDLYNAYLEATRQVFNGDYENALDTIMAFEWGHLVRTGREVLGKAVQSAHVKFLDLQQGWGQSLSLKAGFDDLLASIQSGKKLDFSVPRQPQNLGEYLDGLKNESDEIYFASLIVLLIKENSTRSREASLAGYADGDTVFYSGRAAGNALTILQEGAVKSGKDYEFGGFNGIYMAGAFDQGWVYFLKKNYPMALGFKKSMMQRLGAGLYGGEWLVRKYKGYFDPYAPVKNFDLSDLGAVVFKDEAARAEFEALAGTAAAKLFRGAEVAIGFETIDKKAELRDTGSGVKADRRLQWGDTSPPVKFNTNTRMTVTVLPSGTRAETNLFSLRLKDPATGTFELTARAPRVAEGGTQLNPEETILLRPGQSYRIGRSSYNNYVVDELEMPFVSRFHGVLTIHPGGWAVYRDAGSLYGSGLKVTGAADILEDEGPQNKKPVRRPVSKAEQDLRSDMSQLSLDMSVISRESMSQAGHSQIFNYSPEKQLEWNQALSELLVIRADFMSLKAREDEIRAKDETGDVPYLFAYGKVLIDDKLFGNPAQPYYYRKQGSRPNEAAIRAAKSALLIVTELQKRAGIVKSELRAADPAFESKLTAFLEGTGTYPASEGVLTEAMVQRLKQQAAAAEGRSLQERERALDAVAALAHAKNEQVLTLDFLEEFLPRAREIEVLQGADGASYRIPYRSMEILLDLARFNAENAAVMESDRFTRLVGNLDKDAATLNDIEDKLPALFPEPGAAETLAQRINQLRRSLAFILHYSSQYQITKGPRAALANPALWAGKRPAEIMADLAKIYKKVPAALGQPGAAEAWANVPEAAVPALYLLLQRNVRAELPAAQRLYYALKGKLGGEAALRKALAADRFEVLSKIGTLTDADAKTGRGRALVENEKKAASWNAAASLQEALALFPNAGLEDKVDLAALFYAERYHIRLSLFTQPAGVWDKPPLDWNNKPIVLLNTPQQDGGADFRRLLEKLQEWSGVFDGIDPGLLLLNPSLTRLEVVGKGRARHRSVEKAILLQLADNARTAWHETGHTLDPNYLGDPYYMTDKVHESLQAFAARNQDKGYRYENREDFKAFLQQFYERRRSAWAILFRAPAYYDAQYAAQKRQDFWPAFLEVLKREKEEVKASFALLDRTAEADIDKWYEDVAEAIIRRYWNVRRDSEQKAIRDDLIEEIHEDLRDALKTVRANGRLDMHVNYVYNVPGHDSNIGIVTDPLIDARLRASYNEWWADFFLQEDAALEAADPEAHELRTILFGRYQGHLPEGLPFADEIEELPVAEEFKEPGEGAKPELRTKASREAAAQAVPETAKAELRANELVPVRQTPAALQITEIMSPDGTIQDAAAQLPQYEARIRDVQAVGPFNWPVAEIEAQLNKNGALNGKPLREVLAINVKAVLDRGHTPEQLARVLERIMELLPPAEGPIRSGHTTVGASQIPALGEARTEKFYISTSGVTDGSLHYFVTNLETGARIHFVDYPSQDIPFHASMIRAAGLFYDNTANRLGDMQDLIDAFYPDAARDVILRARRGEAVEIDSVEGLQRLERLYRQNREAFDQAAAHVTIVLRSPAAQLYYTRDFLSDRNPAEVEQNAERQQALERIAVSYQLELKIKDDVDASAVYELWRASRKAGSREPLPLPEEFWLGPNATYAGDVLDHVYKFDPRLIDRIRFADGLKAVPWKQFSAIRLGFIAKRADDSPQERFLKLLEARYKKEVNPEEPAPIPAPAQLPAPAGTLGETQSALAAVLEKGTAEDMEALRDILFADLVRPVPLFGEDLVSLTIARLGDPDAEQRANASLVLSELTGAKNLAVTRPAVFTGLLQALRARTLQDGSGATLFLHAAADVFDYAPELAADASVRRLLDEMSRDLNDGALLQRFRDADEDADYKLRNGLDRYKMALSRAVYHGIPEGIDFLQRQLEKTRGALSSAGKLDQELNYRLTDIRDNLTFAQDAAQVQERGGRPYHSFMSSREVALIQDVRREAMRAQREKGPMDPGRLLQSLDRFVKSELRTDAPREEIPAPRRPEAREVTDKRVFVIGPFHFKIRLVGEEVQILLGKDVVVRKVLTDGGQGLTIGSSTEVKPDFLIDSRRVSKLHAFIYRKGNQYFLEDAGSTNGTLIVNEGNIQKTELQFTAPEPDLSSVVDSMADIIIPQEAQEDVKQKVFAVGTEFQALPLDANGHVDLVKALKPSDDKIPKGAELVTEVRNYVLRYVKDTDEAKKQTAALQNLDRLKEFPELLGYMERARRANVLLVIGRPIETRKDFEKKFIPYLKELLGIFEEMPQELLWEITGPLGWEVVQTKEGHFGYQGMEDSMVGGGAGMTVMFDNLAEENQLENTVVHEVLGHKRHNSKRMVFELAPNQIRRRGGADDWEIVMSGEGWARIAALNGVRSVIPLTKDLEEAIDKQYSIAFAAHELQTDKMPQLKPQKILDIMRKLFQHALLYHQDLREIVAFATADDDLAAQKKKDKEIRNDRFKLEPTRRVLLETNLRVGSIPVDPANKVYAAYEYNGLPRRVKSIGQGILPTYTKHFFRNIGTDEAPKWQEVTFDTKARQWAAVPGEPEAPAAPLGQAAPQAAEQQKELPRTLPDVNPLEVTVDSYSIGTVAFKVAQILHEGSPAIILVREDNIRKPVSGPKTVTPSNPMRLGKAPDNDLVILGPTVSRYHAQIREVDGEYFLVDMDSTNGVVHYPKAGKEGKKQKSIKLIFTVAPLQPPGKAELRTQQETAQAFERVVQNAKLLQAKLAGMVTDFEARGYRWMKGEDGEIERFIAGLSELEKFNLAFLVDPKPATLQVLGDNFQRIVNRDMNIPGLLFHPSTAGDFGELNERVQELAAAIRDWLRERAKGFAFQALEYAAYDLNRNFPSPLNEALKHVDDAQRGLRAGDFAAAQAAVGRARDAIRYLQEPPGMKSLDDAFLLFELLKGFGALDQAARPAELRGQGQTDAALAASKQVIRVLSKNGGATRAELREAAERTAVVLNQEQIEIDAFVERLRSLARVADGGESLMAQDVYERGIEFLLGQLSAYLQTRPLRKGFTVALDLPSSSDLKMYADPVKELESYIGRMVVRGQVKGPDAQALIEVLGARLSRVSSFRQVRPIGDQRVVPGISPAVLGEIPNEFFFDVNLEADAEVRDPRVRTYAALLQLVVGIMAASEINDPNELKVPGERLKGTLLKHFALFAQYQDGRIFNFSGPQSVSISLSTLAGLLSTQFFANEVLKASA
ncbi:MAG TPA: FHA domain-containing protein [Verrucomicrobiae bacterium]|nr:FHA domain-containing protein [Verrucomicrobiae bacterium]